MLSEPSTFWASGFNGLVSSSTPTRRASSTFASIGRRRVYATRTRTALHSTFFDFSHIWAKSQKGVNGVRQVTAKSRYARALAAVGEWCRQNRYLSLRERHAHLSQMMRGHYAYYGISGNSRCIRWFAGQVVVVWRKWLSRRDRQGVFLMGPAQCNPQAPACTTRPDCPSPVRHREQGSPVKNQMLEIGSSGSVRGEERLRIGESSMIAGALSCWLCSRPRQTTARAV